MKPTIITTLLALALSSQLLADDLLLVTNKGDQTLSLIDPVKMEEITAIPEEGITGHEVAASVDGKLAFVPIFGNSGVGKPGTDGQIIQVIDLDQKKIIHSIDFGKGVRPHEAITNKTTGLLYVTTENNNSVSIIDPQKFEILGEVTTGEPESHMLAVSKDGKRGYTANVGPGNVSVLDFEKRALVKKIPVATRVQRISLTIDDKFVFTADQFTPQIAVIDTEKLEIDHWIPLSGIAYGTAGTPDGKYLVAALINDNKLGLIDLAERKLIKTLDVPQSPQEVLIRPDGEFAYVSCSESKQVVAVNLKEWKVEKLINVGAGADGLAWAER